MTITTNKVITVCVAIPHFFLESAASAYGSSRKNNRLRRSLALGRCLSSVLALGTSNIDFLLDINSQHIRPLNPVRPFNLDILVLVNIFTNQDFCLDDVLTIYNGRINVHRTSLDSPSQLPLFASRWLLTNLKNFDLYLYLEDDLALLDPMFIFKYLWFQESYSSSYILMPHRFESAVANAPSRLLVDGPNNINVNDSEPIPPNSPNCTFPELFGPTPSFISPSNPHSGYLLSSKQQQDIRGKQWKPQYYISPLETAATGVLLPHFKILKPSYESYNFLTIDHCDPSFLSYLSKWPLQNQ